MRNSRWALLDVVKTLGHRFEADWRVLPWENKRAWARSVLTGLLLTVALLLLLIGAFRFVAAGRNHFAWEENALRAIERGPISFGSALWLQTFGADFMLVLVVLVACGLAAAYHRPLLAVSIPLALIVMDAIVRIGWLVLARQRPDLIAEGIASPGFHSFPSGHTSKTLVVYGLLIAQWLRASQSIVEKLLALLLLLVIVIIVPFGRLRMGVHWPTDILGGYLLGGIWLGFLLLALRKEN